MGITLGCRNAPYFLIGGLPILMFWNLRSRTLKGVVHLVPQ